MAVTKAVHQNSLASFAVLSTAQRRADILSLIRETNNLPLTDREICTGIGYLDMNAVRPRITEMVKDGTLLEAGKVKDPVTNRSVRTVQIISETNQAATALA